VIPTKDVYFVAVKVFLEKDGKLLIMKDNFGDWDLPGGRIKTNEFKVPLKQVLQRKMFEELGNKIKYSIGEPSVCMRHKRIEAAPGNPEVKIFAVGYQCTLESGEIQLSKRHTEMKWVDPINFKPEDYFTGGWLQGVKDYLETKRLHDTN
jgi:ADP-ribose pyrophosphatase YjhB (NUDIX family)